MILNIYLYFRTLVVQVHNRAADCGYLACLFSLFVSAGKATSLELDVVHTNKQKIQSGSDNTRALFIASDSKIIVFLCSSASGLLLQWLPARTLGQMTMFTCAVLLALLLKIN